MWNIVVLFCVLIHCAVCSQPQQLYGSQQFGAASQEFQLPQLQQSSQLQQSTQPLPITKLPAPVAAFPQAIHWDDCTQSIYYVDLLANRSQISIFRYDYEENRTYAASIVGQKSPSFILPLSLKCDKNQNRFAVGISHNVEVIEWDGRAPTANVVGTLFGAESNDPASVWDIGRPSENGVFYGGTFHIDSFCSGSANSSFYRYVNTRSPELLFTGVIATTGVATDVKRNMLYHIDTCTWKITGFDLDSKGNICNGRVIYNFRTAPEGSWPISLDTDTEGFVYTVSYFDGTVFMIDPRTSEAKIIVQLPSGLNGIAFGGPNRDILFAIRGTNVIDPFNGSLINIIRPGTSLYKVTGLGRKGLKYRQLNASLK